VLKSSCSYSFQVLDLGTGACTPPTIWTTNLNALDSHMHRLRERGAKSPLTHILSGGFTTATICSLQF